MYACVLDLLVLVVGCFHVLVGKRRRQVEERDLPDEKQEMEPSELPKDLLESVQEAVGRGLELTLSCQLQPEVKGEKVDKVLALSSHRAYQLSARFPSKVEHSFSYLDIHGLCSNKPTQVLVECQRGPCTLWFSSQKDSDRVIAHVGACLTRICPDMNLLKKFHVTPSERWAALMAVWEQLDPAGLGPCGGFSVQYRAVCDNLNLAYREEVQWDVDTIYLSQDTTELNLHDFSHLDGRDLVAIVGTLEYNKWFTKLVAKDFKLSADVCEQILHVISQSSCLEELVLDNVGLRSDFAHKLSLALAHNPASTLHTLNLSNNSLDDKGMCALGAQLGKLAMGLKRVNLSKTSLSPKGVNLLCQALCRNPSVAASLTHLQLTGNSLRGDDLQHLHNFLSHDNRLQVLDLSSTDCSLEQTSSSLLKGCLKHLRVLNMSKTIYSHRKCREVPASFKQFFSLSQALVSVNVSGCRLPAEALKALLLGLGCNPNLGDVSLDLSGCELRSAGAQILEGCVAEIPNISSLDISDNGLDGDLSTLLVWLAKNRSVRHLSLGRNFQNMKSKNVAPVLDKLVRLIQEEESPLSSLSLADSKLKGDLVMVLNALGSNTSLTQLDISGNAMGDMGAKMLAKALQINTKLRTLVWDRNNVSPQGLQEVASALEKNFTIRFMPVPIVDAAQALKTHPEKTEDALLKMEHFLLRNHETRKYLQEQAYRLQQGIVTSTTQQMMDTMCVKVQDHLNSLMFSQDRLVREDMKIAENLMNDARNSKTLLPCLYHLGGDAFRGAIQDKLESVAVEVAAVMEEQLRTMLASMLEAASGLCPHVMKMNRLSVHLMKAGAEKMSVPRTFFSQTLLEQTGVDILNKISELKLGAASLISDCVVDGILDSLSTWRHTLANHVSRQLQPESQEERQILDETILYPEFREEGGQADACVTTAKSKRKSILVRMLRPVSVAFEMEFDLDKALQEVPIHVVEPPPPLPVPDLAPAFPPLGSPPPLQHHTKLRPKTRRRTKASRVGRETAPVVEHEGMMGRLDEGVDEFFTKKVLKVSLKRLAAQAMPLNTHELVDKKRESRKSGFFNLIKGQTSRSEKSQGAAASVMSPWTTSPSPVLSAPMTPVNVLTDESLPTSPSMEHSETTASAPSSGEAEEKDVALLPRRVGVPVMGADLLAEIKARQKKMASHKLESSKEGHMDAEQSRPETSPRSKDPIVSTKSPLCPPVTESLSLPSPSSVPSLPSPLSPSSVPSLPSPSNFPSLPSTLGSGSTFVPNDSVAEGVQVPLPAPRLKREPSQNDEHQDSNLTDDSVAEGFQVPLPAPRLKREPSQNDGHQDSNLTAWGVAAASPRQQRWSSLKTSPRRCPDVRQRAKSLPTYSPTP
ncbi:F-actin-uncapping protein LRRC16A isoform X2 [Syngnathus scovelli]|uniref:F-actin-uncapping protein LRRC16A isoform X2 n=1 Tax=Syngnathus scovelli TaxID=161590 RepID=UPI0021104B19|nr:F-actin-uncapping protein LRRC16A isoform X2 [Syngnathus scovelli]